MLLSQEVRSNIADCCFRSGNTQTPSISVLALRSLVMVLMKGFSLLMSEVEVCQALPPQPHPTKNTFSAHANHPITQPA